MSETHNPHTRMHMSSITYITVCISLRSQICDLWKKRQQYRSQGSYFKFINSEIHDSIVALREIRSSHNPL